MVDATQVGITEGMAPARQVGKGGGEWSHPKKPFLNRLWKGRWAYLFVLIPVAGYFVFFLYPALFAFFTSFYNYDFFQFKALEHPLYNYMRAFRDPQFERSYRNVIELVIISWVGGQSLSLFLAVMLNSIRRLSSFLRTLYFIPVVTSVVVVAALFRWLYGGDAYYPVNAVLHAVFGIEPQRWLWDDPLVIPSISFAAIWLSLGFSIVIWTAGLRGIPAEYYELALLEGATPWQKFWRITLPLLKPIIIYQAVMGVIGGMKEFSLVYAMTSYAGGAGMAQLSSITPVIMVYHQGFKQLQMGYASAVAYILTMILLVLSSIQFKIFGGTITYE